MLRPSLFLATTAQAQIPSSIEFRVPKPPTVAVNDSGGVLVYELHVTNLTTAPVKLTRVDVLDPSGARRSAALPTARCIRAMARPGLAAARAGADGDRRGAARDRVPLVRVDRESAAGVGAPATRRSRAVPPIRSRRRSRAFPFPSHRAPSR